MRADYYVGDAKKAKENADKQAVIHQIPFFFKYNAVEYEPKHNEANNDDEKKGDDDMDPDDADEVLSQGSALEEYQRFRFEWELWAPHSKNAQMTHRVDGDSYKV